MIALDYSH